MSAETVQLQEVCRIIQGGRLGLSGNDFVPQGYPAYGAGGMNGFLPSYEFDEPAVVLSAIGARCGKCFYAEGKWHSLANTQLIFPDPDRADAKFLWYQLNDERRWHRSGTGQPFIKPADVKSHSVFLPPIAEQRRIAEILDKADALRAERRAALAQLDTLTQSIFIDMFGDPATNPRGWPIVPLQSKCIIAGEYGANVASTEFDPALPRYVRITDVTEEGTLNEQPVSPAASRIDWEQYELAPGDLLFARSGATVGKAYVHKESNGRCVFAGYMIRFRPDRRELLPEYLFAFTRTAAYRAWVAVRQRVVAQPNINAKQYGKELLIPLPPIRQQEAFAARMVDVERMKTLLRTSRVTLDALFAALQHAAFRGAH